MPLLGLVEASVIHMAPELWFAFVFGSWKPLITPDAIRTSLAKPEPPLLVRAISAYPEGSAGQLPATGGGGVEPLTVMLRGVPTVVAAFVGMVPDGADNVMVTVQVPAAVEAVMGAVLEPVAADEP